MTVDIRSEFTAVLKTRHDDDSGADKSATHEISINDTREFGSGADQVDGVYSALPLSLSASPQTLDLQAVTDAFGAALSFAKIFRIVIVNKSSTPGDNLTLGNAAANAWEPFISTGGTITVPPDGEWVWSDPAGATVDGANKDLKLDPGAGAFDVDVQIIGTKS